jgi:hypothetical protein
MVDIAVGAVNCSGLYNLINNVCAFLGRGGYGYGGHNGGWGGSL